MVVTCGRCGRKTVDDAVFCPGCGATIDPRGPPATLPAPPKKDRTPLIVVIVVAIILIAAIVMVSALDALTSGIVGDRSSAPSVELTLDNAAYSGIRINVSSADPEEGVSLSEVLIDLQTPEWQITLDGSVPRSPNEAFAASNGTNTLSFYDVDGSETITEGDLMTIEAMNGALPEGIYEIILSYSPTGDTLASMTVTIP